jgi:hypothetical protein
MTDNDETAGIALLALMLDDKRSPEYIDTILDMSDNHDNALLAALITATNLMRCTEAIERQRQIVRAMATNLYA